LYGHAEIRYEPVELFDRSKDPSPLYFILSSCLIYVVVISSSLR
jgi:hypothetical protein